MPIYEYYCSRCHTVFNFFSQRVDAELVPDCPRDADHQLQRKPSRFSMVSLSSASEEGPEEDDLFPGMDEGRLERAMDELAGEFENLGEGAEDDPRTMARMFRRFSEVGGLEPGPKMEEILARLERADDIEEVESELEGFDDDDADLDEFFRVRKAVSGWRDRQPAVDETLHFI